MLARRPVRVDILGCPFDVISFLNTIQYFRQAIDIGQRLYCASGNVDMVMKCRRDAQLSRYFWDSDLVLADGVPILWAARLLGTPLEGRVNGTDLLLECGRLSAETGYALGFVGGEYAVATRAATVIRNRFPGSTVHVFQTPFPLTPDASMRIAGAIKEHGCHLLFVALGAPLQERWIREYLESSGAVVGIGIGSAFDLISAHRTRAPRWMQRNGLEWLFRLLQEPRRLGRRYLIEDMPFLWHLGVQVIRRRIVRRQIQAS